MEFLVKKSITAIDTILCKLNDEANLLAESIENDSIKNPTKDLTLDKDLLRTNLNDISKVVYFQQSYLKGNLDIANQITQSFDTYTRELIPMIAWELIGNHLVHDKDKQINQTSQEMVMAAADILSAYNSGDISKSEKLEVKFHEKYARQQKDQVKDRMLDNFLEQVKAKNEELSEIKLTIKEDTLKQSQKKKPKLK